MSIKMSNIFMIAAVSLKINRNWLGGSIEKMNLLCTPLIPAVYVMCREAHLALDEVSRGFGRMPGRGKRDTREKSVGLCNSDRSRSQLRVGLNLPGGAFAGVQTRRIRPRRKRSGIALELYWDDRRTQFALDCLYRKTHCRSRRNGFCKSRRSYLTKMVLLVLIAPFNTPARKIS